MGPSPLQGNKAISVQEKIGRLLHLVPQQMVRVESCVRSSTALSRVEVTIVDGCLPRQEMWQFLQNLQNHFVYVSQRLAIADCEVEISGLTKEGVPMFGGLITNSTDVLFYRSNCRMYLVIHITREILVADNSGYLRGEIVTDYCLSKLCELWKQGNTHHLVTVLLYMSIFPSVSYHTDLDVVFQDRVYPLRIPFVKVSLLERFTGRCCARTRRTTWSR